MPENSLLSRLDGIESRFEEVGTLITDPGVIADMRRYVKLTKEYKDLERLTKATRRYRSLLDDMAEAREVLDTENDDDMRLMAKEQLDEASAELPELEQEIKLLLIPADPEDAKMRLSRSEVAPEVMRRRCLPVICSRCIRNIVNLRVGRSLSQVSTKVLPVDIKRSYSWFLEIMSMAL